jgi:hypothetical protein
MLIQGLIVICMGLPLFYLGYIVYKKSSFAKLCRGSYAVIFRGPDKAWVRLLPAKNGLIQKPEGKYLLKKEKKINFSWPQGGYVVPKDTNIPYIMWPLTGSDSVKSPVGLLVYDIGNPMPRQGEGIDALGRNHSSPIDPDTIDAINDARIAREIFVDIPDELRKDAKKGGKLGDLIPWIAIGLCALTLVLVFIMYTNVNTMAGDISTIKGGMGY